MSNDTMAFDLALAALPDVNGMCVVPVSALNDAIGWLKYSSGNSLMAGSERLLAETLSAHLTPIGGGT